MKTPSSQILFKATNKQLKDGSISFEQLRDVFKELKIDSQYKLSVAKKDKILKIPNYYTIDEICRNIKGQTFDEFFQFKRSITKPRQIDRITEQAFVEKLQKWCSDNNIKSKADYAAFKSRPKEFPTVKTIVSNYGDDYFTNILGLKLYKEKLEDRLIEEDFKNELRKWCIDNKITSIAQYNTTKKPKGFPSGERIRQIYGYEYFADALGIKYRNYEFLTKEEARQVCLDNGVYYSNHYPKFYQLYNEKHDKKLPSNPYKYYQTDWANFIKLSDTQLFIGNSMSNLELFTYKLLYDRGIEFETEKTFENCRSKNPLPFDFFLPNVIEQPVIIELDGEHHRATSINNKFYTPKIKEHDKIKNIFCFENNIKLIRIEDLFKIESELIREINLNSYPKIKDLDWTSDFQTEKDVIESKLVKSIKVKLLLLMAERGKCSLSNVEIINLTKISKPQFYGLKNELINLGLITRETDYYFSEMEMKRIAELYKEGKNISEIVRETGYKNRAYLVKRLKDMGVTYKSRKSSKEDADNLRSKVIELYLLGYRPVEISKNIKASQGYISLLIQDYKISIGEIKPDEKTIKTAKQTRELLKNGVTMKEISKILATSTQHLYKCLRWTEKELDSGNL